MASSHLTREHAAQPHNTPRLGVLLQHETTSSRSDSMLTALWIIAVVFLCSTALALLIGAGIRVGQSGEPDVGAPAELPDRRAA